MPQVAKSDHSTGNSSFASYVLKSDELTFIFTAPYSQVAAPADSTPAVPSYNMDAIYSFINKHGLGVRAVGEWPKLAGKHSPAQSCISSSNSCSHFVIDECTAQHI